jgi:hypothetical protein
MVAASNTPNNNNSISGEGPLTGADYTTMKDGCSYSDGSQYNTCMTAEKGWPFPANFKGGKRSKGKMMRTKGSKMKRNLKRTAKMAKSRSSSLARRARMAGSGFAGMLKTALVPFGLFAIQKRMQNKSKKAKKGMKKSKTMRK